MDQLKVILGQLKKHNFWVLSTVALLFSLTGWYMASAQLIDEYTTNKNKIESEFNELRQIVSQTNHPNEKFEAGTKVLTTQLTRDVQLAWSNVYKDQKAKVLKWPEALGKDFLEWMEAAGPTEDIPIDYRDRYLNYVKEEFPRLLQIVDARPFWDRDEAEAGDARGSVRPRLEEGVPGRRKRTVTPRKDYLVIWEGKNQEEIDQSLDFREGIPSSTAVRYCQENLWVYHALLDAIAIVNEGATGNHNAKIKEIVSLNIGKSASDMMLEALTSSRLVGMTGATGEGGEPGMGMGMPGMSMGPELGGRATPGLPAGGAGMEAEGLEGAQSQNALDDKRYVDEKGMPLPSGTPGPAEFKRMPILMRLVMDQREIARLLVTLADLPLPVEIQQVRINTKMPGIKREPHRQFGYGQEGGDVRGSRRTSIAMPRDQALDETLQYPFDLAVEVAGFIYIFNPPDKSLSVAEGDAEAPAEGEAAAPEAGAAAAEPEAAEPATDSPEKPAASDNERGEGPADAPSDAVTPQDGGNQPGAPAEPEAGAEEKPKPESPPAGFDSGAEPAGAANNENGQPQPE